jgi:NAD(P)-dependent dehydrogenase (short-subunit alcohol dehydrogenase family)|tara:strand:- start:1636 stop:2385 length:750 start_codon:yes stop_codon:yes gene_type:complete
VNRLEGKNAIITGAASGIGAAIAKRFAFEGANVALLDLNIDIAEKNAAKLRSEGKLALAKKIDLLDESSVIQTFGQTKELIGPVHILVNSAGIADGSPLAELSSEKWDEMMGVNLRGSFLCCREVIPYMRENQWGRIINIASEVANRGHPGLSHYAASKAAVIAMTKCLALEVVKDNIRANVLSPGPTETSMISGIDETTLSNLLTDLMPIGRLAQPDEIAGAAMYLASEEADFCVGMTLNINGGTYRI